jgi:hypothetical protein
MVSVQLEAYARTKAVQSFQPLQNMMAACAGKHAAAFVCHTFGQLLRFTRNLWYALPAFSSGFSVRPPPATWPTIARHVLGSTCMQA